MTGNMALPLTPQGQSVVPSNGHIAKALKKRWLGPQKRRKYQQHQTSRIPVARLTG